MPAHRQRPLIGISAYWRPVDFGAWRGFPVTLVPQGYVDGVVAAGGMPFLVPPVPVVVDDPGLALDPLDGLVLAGGEDLDPATYGADRHPATGTPNEVRDRAELALLRAALERNLPVLGICRGAQLLNVVCGGDLVQDMSEVVELHPHLPEPGAWGRHRVRVTGGRLRELAGDEIAAVSSHHHQSLGRIGEGLVATGESPDGVVEAVEDPGREFCIGVLWHPEEDARAGGAPLFRGLVDAARAFAAQRR
ncbi:MAG TPA: gamma-glutamyl-gamma-aminobutyrate hydrolase family protein [Gaiellaceae bacterium]|nr:gamma-glutamyl-gamma-aminobutyrate hydrolase family protein [Gaiellaceae bacterium]